MTLPRKSISLTLAAIGLLLLTLSLSQGAVTAMIRVLYSFAGGNDVKGPTGSLVADAAGVLYGTSFNGGGSANCFDGCGTVYKYANGVESVLYAFTGGVDGSFIKGGLYVDGQGNLYGATGLGGANNFGTIFKVTAAGVKTTLYSFAGGTNDGANPNGNLIADAAGNLYGTTYSGGIGDCTGGCGTVFKLTPGGDVNVIYFFGGGATGDGASPPAGLTPDGQGNFYGVTFVGGPLSPKCGMRGCGTIFHITTEGEETVFHAFRGEGGASNPASPVIMDAQGNLYGDSLRGGDKGRKKGFGTVYELSADGRETVLHSFLNGGDGYEPSSGLVMDAAGNLFGTSFLGGPFHFGIIYQITPDRSFQIYYAFNSPSHQGYSPIGKLYLKSDGTLIGNNLRGGAAGDNGTIFAVSP